MARKALILFSAAVLGCFAFGVFLGVAHARRQARERDEVHFWVRSMGWWNLVFTEKQQSDFILTNLRKHKATSLRVLTGDLAVRSSLSRWRGKIPVLNRYFPTGVDEDDREITRTSAAFYLGDFGHDAQPAIPELLRVLSDDVDQVRMAAALALGQIGDSSPQVLAALGHAATNISPNLAFSSELSLWLLTHADEHRQRAETLVGSAPNWAAICLSKLGETGRPFAGALESIRDTLPFCDSKMAVVRALWETTRDKARVLRAFDELVHELDHPRSTNRLGWTSGETGLANAASTLDVEPEFRAALRPLLSKALQSRNPNVVRVAQVHLEKHAKLDQARLQTPGVRPGGLLEPPPVAGP